MEKKVYDILIRKDGEQDYAAFCPQFNILVRGTSHEEVEKKTREKIFEHLNAEKKSEDEIKIYIVG